MENRNETYTYIVFFFILSLLTLTYLFYKPGPLDKEKKIFIEKGLVLDDVIFLLKSNDIIESKKVFKLYSRIFISDTTVKAGEYLFDGNISLSDIFKKLKNGKTIYRKILIPECYTVKQTVNLLLANDYISGSLEKLPSEGSLFPNTYFFERGEDINKLILRISNSMQSKVEEVWKYNKGLFLNQKELITFASMVEAESKKQEEKKLVSSVFHNRLKINMKLQSDPTLLYYKNLTSKEKVNEIYRSDIKKDHPWNTYTRFGLPATAICNPGLEALHAAIKPKESNFLYFVSDGQGGHRFSTSLKEHNQNIKKWKMNKKK